MLEEGFIFSADPTILAIADDTGRLAVKYIYWPMEQEMEPMRDLGALVLDPTGLLLKKNVKGQYHVIERGAKAMNSGSIMLMYGSHAQYNSTNHPVSADGKKHHLPAVYQPSGQVDAQVNAAVVRHVDHLSAMEHQMIPAYAAHRDALADETDPQRRHRFACKSRVVMR